MVGIILRIVFCILCIYIARRKNRNMVGWGFFGFFLPLVAIIWISCLKVHQDRESNPDLDSKND